MSLRETLTRALTGRFASYAPRVGVPPDPLAIFPARHVEVGDLSVRTDERNYTVTAFIGQAFATHFTNYDTHLDDGERVTRLTEEVVRFVRELFADRLLFWNAADGRGSAWRERGSAGPLDPLVLDNRVYHAYLWSRPLGPWQAIPVILGRGRIQSGHEYEILTGHLKHPLIEHLDVAQRELASKLVAEYEQ